MPDFAYGTVNKIGEGDARRDCGVIQGAESGSVSTEIHDPLKTSSWLVVRRGAALSQRILPSFGVFSDPAVAGPPAHILLAVP
jgi:hypothetical protein